MLSKSMSLEGAPDALIGTAEAKGNAVQVVQLDMSNDVLDELLDCIRRGKPPQVLFGRSPVCIHLQSRFPDLAVARVVHANERKQVLRYEGKSHSLQSQPEKYRHELYQSTNEGKPNEWNFAGLINHSLEIQRVEEASAKTDKALETLKNNMAAIEHEREGRRFVSSAIQLRAWGRVKSKNN
jgi:RNA polymerase II elongation factor ELL